MRHRVNLKRIRRIDALASEDEVNLAFLLLNSGRQKRRAKNFYNRMIAMYGKPHSLDEAIRSFQMCINDGDDTDDYEYVWRGKIPPDHHECEVCESTSKNTSLVEGTSGGDVWLCESCEEDCTYHCDTCNDAFVNLNQESPLFGYEYAKDCYRDVCESCYEDVFDCPVCEFQNDSAYMQSTDDDGDFESIYVCDKHFEDREIACAVCHEDIEHAIECVYIRDETIFVHTECVDKLPVCEICHRTTLKPRCCNTCSQKEQVNQIPLPEFDEKGVTK